MTFPAIHTSLLCSLTKRNSKRTVLLNCRLQGHLKCLWARNGTQVRLMVGELTDGHSPSNNPLCCYLIYKNGSEFKLHFRALCDSYGIKRKPTSVKNPQANAILECIHAVVMNMFGTAEIDMTNSVKPSDIDIFLSDAAWAICSTHLTVLKASSGAAIFGLDMLFDILFIAD